MGAVLALAAVGTRLDWFSDGIDLQRVEFSAVFARGLLLMFEEAALTVLREKLAAEATAQRHRTEYEQDMERAGRLFVFHLAGAGLTLTTEGLRGPDRGKVLEEQE